MLVNKLQASEETRNLLQVLTFLVSQQKLNEYLVQCVLETTSSQEQ